MRRIAKVDDNQQEIVKALRKAGASVYITSNVGCGFVDVVIGFRGTNYLFEIKDGSKPTSRQKLTEDEQKFFDNWNGTAHVIKNVDEALKTIGVI